MKATPKTTPKTAPADVHITSLTLELPASLGARKHRIVRLLRSELMRLEWPKGDLARLDLPPLPLSSQQTNLAIARQLAQALITSAQRQLAQGGRL